MGRFFATTNPDRYKILSEFAKQNRNNPTLAENYMWKQLKGKRLGVKFIRQHAILDFIADFICLERKIIVEIDGEYHLTATQIREDNLREERLIAMGYKIIRFSNNEVLFNTPQTIRKLKEFINNN